MSRTRVIPAEPYWLVTLALVIGDQLTKYYVGSLHRPLELGPVSVAKVVNSFGVFGWNVANGLLIAVGILIAAILLWLIFRSDRPPARLGLWLLLGGVVSNMIDRITAGGAVDIIGISGFSRFNLADVMIALGALSIIRSLWPARTGWSDGPARPPRQSDGWRE